MCKRYKHLTKKSNSFNKIGNRVEFIKKSVEKMGCINYSIRWNSASSNHLIDGVLNYEV